MSSINGRTRKMLREQARRAWEAEMRATLGALGDKFELWKAGRMTSADLHDAIHAYHDGIGRDIWKRYAIGDPKLPLAHAVAAGLVARDSLPPEVQQEISSLVEYFEAPEEDQPAV